ncbi:MAG: response regulator [Eubacterium sp.]|nr:response regulator [Eubacterium sp.]
MNNIFAETLQRLRTERNISQQQLASKMFVGRSTIANWETGRRVPDALLMSRLAKCLDVDVSVLLESAHDSEEAPNIILIDDEKIILSGGLPVLENVFPGAQITGFNKPSDAIRFVESTHVSLAFLDIEMGKMTGFEICEKLIDIDPFINVIFLTAYSDYALDAWSTGACGFMLKPLMEDNIRKQLKHLRHPL